MLLETSTLSIVVQTSLDDKVLENRISRFAQKHTETLRRRVEKNRLIFFEPDDEYGKQVAELSFQTHFGADTLFWHPLFEKLTGRMPIFNAPDDEAFWNKIFPAGASILNNMRSHHPSTVGTYQYPLPDLLA